MESILRHHGLKTGFFSSPHLIEPLERIRINSTKISPQKFTDSFFHVFETLFPSLIHSSIQQINKTTLQTNLQTNLQTDFQTDFQTELQYFSLLTLMSFKLFQEEKVDVGIIEVGIGGRFDSTNIIPSPICCGITLIDYDHMAELGEKITEIAHHKAGIIKSNTPIVTSPQREEVLRVFEEEAKEKNSKFLIAQNFDEFVNRTGRKIEVGIPGDHQLDNASLALSLSHLFLDYYSSHNNNNNININNNMKNNVYKNNMKEEKEKNGYKGRESAPVFKLSKEDISGLQRVSWPGRSQKIIYQINNNNYNNIDNNNNNNKRIINFYLDGAHTPVSIAKCMNWFLKEINNNNININNENNNINDNNNNDNYLNINNNEDKEEKNKMNILIFNQTNLRSALGLLKPVVDANEKIHFNEIILFNYGDQMENNISALKSLSNSNSNFAISLVSFVLFFYFSHYFNS